MKFEWDPKKAARNLKKHQVSFEEAATVFGDPRALIFDDELHSQLEQREIIIGHSLSNRVLLVFFTERHEDVIRLFSARIASSKERYDYEENKRNQASEENL